MDFPKNFAMNHGIDENTNAFYDPTQMKLYL